MIAISPHAEEEMKKSGINKEEIEQCIGEGKLITKQIVKGKMRYGKRLDLKDRKIVVIYAIDKRGNEKVITCYPIRRKKWWKG